MNKIYFKIYFNILGQYICKKIYVWAFAYMSMITTDLEHIYKKVIINKVYMIL